MQPEEAKKEAKKISDWIIDIRRELHKHPELMYEEVKTSALVRRELDNLGIEYQSPCNSNIIIINNPFYI